MVAALARVQVVEQHTRGAGVSYWLHRTVCTSLVFDGAVSHDSFFCRFKNATPTPPILKDNKAWPFGAFDGAGVDSSLPHETRPGLHQANLTAHKAERGETSRTDIRNTPEKERLYMGALLLIPGHGFHALSVHHASRRRIQ